MLLCIVRRQSKETNCALAEIKFVAFLNELGTNRNGQVARDYRVRGPWLEKPTGVASRRSLGRGAPWGGGGRFQAQSKL